MIIRWLGAYPHRKYKYTLSQALDWELSTSNRRPVAAERLIRNKSRIKHAHVGLVAKNSAVVKRWKGDVFSRKKEGRMVATRKPRNTHTEVWMKPVFCGIIIDGRISEYALKQCQDAAKKFEVPLLRLTRDRKVVKMK